jgi:GntR family transcriptional regulator
MPLAAGPLPLYHQVEQDLRARVHAREFVPGSALPSEERIGEHYGVSRITVRRALDALIAQGLIVRRRGVGSFVTEPEQGTRSIALRGSLDEFLAGAGVMQPEGLNMTHDARNAKAAALLGLDEDAPLSAVELVSRIDDQPAAHLEIYFPEQVGRQLLPEDFQTPGVPIIRAVERRLNLRVNRARQEIEADAAGARTARYLGLTAGDPILSVTRAYYLPSEQAIEVVFVRYHPARYRYLIDFVADGSR